MKERNASSSDFDNPCRNSIDGRSLRCRHILLSEIRQLRNRKACMHDGILVYAKLSYSLSPLTRRCRPCCPSMNIGYREQVAFRWQWLYSVRYANGHAIVKDVQREILSASRPNSWQAAVHRRGHASSACHKYRKTRSDLRWMRQCRQLHQAPGLRRCPSSRVGSMQTFEKADTDGLCGVRMMRTS